MRLSQNTLCTLPKWGWVTSSSSPSPKAILYSFQSHLSLDSGMGLEPPNDSKVDSRTCPTTPLTTHISRRPPLSRTQSGTTVYVTKHPRPQRFAWLIEPISIHEWEWELIHYFLQWMGMGTYSSFFREWTQVWLDFSFRSKNVTKTLVGQLQPSQWLKVTKRLELQIPELLESLLLIRDPFLLNLESSLRNLPLLRDKCLHLLENYILTIAKVHIYA